jgi:glycosyltransferase involved in cell wall biosynthesis
MLAGDEWQGGGVEDQVGMEQPARGNAIDTAARASWEEFERSCQKLHERWRSNPAEVEQCAPILRSLERNFVDLVRRTGSIRALAALALPMLYEVAHERPGPEWAEVVKQTRELPVPPTPTGRLMVAVCRLVLAAPLEGCDPALAAFARCLAESARGECRDLAAEIGKRLHRHGWLAGLRPLFRAAAEQHLVGLRPDDPVALCSLLGFSTEAKLEHLEWLTDRFVLRWMEQLLEQREFDHALDIEVLLYDVLVKKVETEQHFAACSRKWMPLMLRAGRQERAVPSVSPMVPEQAPSVAFVLHTAQTLGHTEALLTFLRGCSQLRPRPIRPLVYVLEGTDARLEECCVAADARVVWIDPRRIRGRFDRLAALRDEMHKSSVLAVVFVSVPVAMALGFAMGLAPVQIWWSMKYHSLEFDEIDGYLALGSFERHRTIGNRVWRIVHRALGPLHDPSLAERARDVRAALGVAEGRTIFGCIGRAEKIYSPRYIAALAAILRRVPDAVYLWTGSSMRTDIASLFKEHGIQDRCFFVGWINSRLYAQVLDVFVDSFPFASGLTAFEAMAAGTPVVAMITSEAMETGWPSHFWPLACGQAGTVADRQFANRVLDDGEGGSLLPCVTTEDDFIARCVRLALDVAYRRRTGAAMKALVEHFMRDARRMGESGCSHLREVIDSKLHTESGRTTAS